MKRFLIALFSIVCLLGLVAILSATVFKEELTEWAIKQKMKKYEQLKMYYVAEIPVEPENFAEDFKSIHQQVIKECINATVNLSVYKQNRDLLYNSLSDYGYECVKPEGAFYLFVKALEEDAYKFFERAKKHELLVVPCDDFGVPGYVRIAYCVDKSRIEKALPHFKALIDEYNS